MDVQPIHLKREDPRIQLADAGSKTLDTDNWSVDQQSFDELDEQVKFDIDLFADAKNKKVKCFCSLYYDPLAHAVNAFSIPWGNLGYLWLCPPVSLLPAVFHRIMQSSCKGMLILPLWSTANFHNLFFDPQGDPRPPFCLARKWHPFIVQNENASDTALFGYTKFQFVALYFNK